MQHRYESLLTPSTQASEQTNCICTNILVFGSEMVYLNARGLPSCQQDMMSLMRATELTTLNLQLPENTEMT